MEASLSQNRLAYDSSSQNSKVVASDTLRYDFITFLATCQNLKIDFLPITWQPALDILGIGGQAEIRQSLVNLATSFAFRRVNISQADLQVDPEAEEKAYEALTSQISLLGHPEIRAHPNIINLIGVCWDVRPGDGIKFQEKPQLSNWKVWPVLVFERAKHGDLNFFMKSKIGGDIGFAARLKLCMDIIAGIRYLHDNRTAHMDIKPHNVLVFEETPGEYTAKIADLGFSIRLDDGETATMPRSRPWEAPEWHHRLETPFKIFNMEIYSLGMVCLWVLFNREMSDVGITFTRTQGLDEPNRLEELKREGGLSKLAKDLIDRNTEMPVHQANTLVKFFSASLSLQQDDRDAYMEDMVQLLDDHGGLEKAKIYTASQIKISLSTSYEHFQFARSIISFYEADYRVRCYIASCLTTVASWNNSYSQAAAFHLAFCFQLGLGVGQDFQKAVLLLKQSRRQPEDLDSVVKLIKEEPDSNIQSSMLLRLYMGGFITQYMIDDYY